jgi:hypothetical protein
VDEVAEPLLPPIDGHDAQAARLDRIAWAVLADLLRQHQGLGDLTVEGLRRIIGLRLEKEAAAADATPEEMSAAFDRALLELIGAGRPSREPSSAEDEGPIETVDDL